MKKDYSSPELDLVKFSFERTLEEQEDDFQNIRHSIAQDIAESGGELD